jgi:hypothetical protein
VDRERVLEEIRLPLGLQNLLEKEARRRNCTVSELIEHAVRADLDHGDFALTKPGPPPHPGQARGEPLP